MVISERLLILPALFVIKSEGGIAATETLIDRLEDYLRPTGKDAEIFSENNFSKSDRNDSFFSQKVRNLKSHETMAKYTNYYDRLPNANGGGYILIPSGHMLTDDATPFLSELFSSINNNMVTEYDFTLGYLYKLAEHFNLLTHQAKDMYKQTTYVFKLGYDHCSAIIEL